MDLLSNLISLTEAYKLFFVNPKIQSLKYFFFKWWVAGTLEPWLMYRTIYIFLDESHIPSRYISFRRSLSRGLYKSFLSDACLISILDRNHDKYFAKAFNAMFIHQAMSFDKAYTALKLDHRVDWRCAFTKDKYFL